jgi:hypothetical protein
MKITDLLSKPAVVQLKDVVSGDVLPVHVKIKPAEDKIVKEAIRKALIDAPKTPGENATDVDKLAYIDAMDKTERVILDEVGCGNRKDECISSDTRTDLRIFNFKVGRSDGYCRKEWRSIE